MSALTATTPLVAGEYDHETQDADCTWCYEQIGTAPYVRGVNGRDLYHAACWDEVSTEVPGPIANEPTETP